MHTQPTSLVPSRGDRRKYSPTAAPTASREQRNCRVDRPKKMASW